MPINEIYTGRLNARASGAGPRVGRQTVLHVTMLPGVHRSRIPYGHQSISVCGIPNCYSQTLPTQPHHPESVVRFQFSYEKDGICCLILNKFRPLVKALIGV